mmetsp:Transcript_57761/g.102470  ORF Transcript_57761/g.102470 Transcript_57761/m.102470 type:complete len:99 (+) Transcript_57761:499-795(+)
MVVATRGNMRRTKKSGKGKFVWKDGSSYDGQWAKGKPNGKGTYGKLGRSWTGQWKNGSPVRDKWDDTQSEATSIFTSTTANTKSTSSGEDENCIGFFN